MALIQTRRGFLGGIAAAGAASLIRAPRAEAAERPLETTTVRLPKIPDPLSNMCTAPVYIAGELLRGEGFIEIRYIDIPPGGASKAIGEGKVDFGQDFGPSVISEIDAGKPIVVLSGVMVGCIEVFAKEGIGGIADLRGRRVGVVGIGSTAHKLLALMAANVGLDPARDIRWVTLDFDNAVKAFEETEVDAYLAAPPQSLDLRARHVGHVLVNIARDRPWSQYFCCLASGNRDYVRRYPVATKRALRALLKAADLCASDPAGAARRVVDGGFTDRYGSTLQTLGENGYDRWREYDAEDTMRFYALRLRDVGFIKSSPQKIIADGTDWRFLDELKRELKA
jgi:NitT/TauT family transport system substrate-binding protein